MDRKLPPELKKGFLKCKDCKVQVTCEDDEEECPANKVIMGRECHVKSYERNRR